MLVILGILKVKVMGRPRRMTQKAESCCDLYCNVVVSVEVSHKASGRVE
jgi:hypothetical protein